MTCEKDRDYERESVCERESRSVMETVGETAGHVQKEKRKKAHTD